MTKKSPQHLSPEHMRMAGKFMKKGQDVQEWLSLASSLRNIAKAAFKQAKEDRQLSSMEWSDPIYKYLVGLTLENLLKGIMIANDPCLIKQRKIDSAITNHNIWTLYADNKLQTIKTDLRPEEQDLMKIAEYYVIWIGRYPIAKDDDTFIKTREIIERLESNLPLCDFDTRFQEIYEKIQQKLLETLTKSTVNQWKSDDMKKKADDMKKWSKDVKY